MEDLISRIYPDCTDEVLQGISALKEKYFGKVDGRSTAKLTEKDRILITYGDGIRQEGSPPLAVLKTFADRYLKNRISAVHLLPCFPYSSDDGFSVIDYYQINPELGDWEDIDRLAEHFDLMFDAVINHISKHSDWFQQYLTGNPEYFDYFVESKPEDDYSQVIRPRALPLHHPFEKNGEQVYIWTTFSEDQVDLNYANYRVFLRVLDVLLFYISRGSRFIRLDAIAFLWKELGTPCIHLEQTHLVIQAYRQVIEAMAPHAVIITETNVPHIENISYFGNGSNEAHMVYNFTLPPLLAYSVHQQDVNVLTDWAQSLELPGEKVCFFNFTASHDGVGVRPLQGIISQDDITELAETTLRHGGFVSYKSNEDGSQSPYELNCNYMDLITDPKSHDDIRIQRFLLTQSVMLCIQGVPGIYYHSLLGSENDRDTALESGINRRINRQKLELGALRDALNEDTCIRGRIFNRYSQMLEIRGNQAVFDPFGKAEYDSEGSLFIIRRQKGESILYAIHNFSDREASFDSLKGSFMDVLNGKHWASNQEKIPPFGFAWLKSV
ncbi:sugar phosphorylase [uncultured Eudoraea sp.]|uniref:sugar phosphorylase n=1 Tax=uncultured Eudoraea sp. TaxID=1035614 RepID=UPI0026044E67|nr:sugar phosphorylase [uncultured Eudoraea sp.]